MQVYAHGKSKCVTETAMSVKFLQDYASFCRHGPGVENKPANALSGVAICMCYGFAVYQHSHDWLRGDEG